MVQRNFAERNRPGQARFIIAADFGRRYCSVRRSGKRRRMQRLANVANRFLPARMAVQKTAARGKVENRETQHNSAKTPQA